MFINIYNILIRFLYPLAIRPYINKRKEHGKEDVKRFNERIGKPKLPRPKDGCFGCTAPRSENHCPCFR